MTPSTPAVDAQQPDHGERKDGDDYLYLTGCPSLKDFLGFVRARAVNPPDAGTLIDEWRAAAEEVRRLEASEAGCADDPVIGEMGLDYEPLLVVFLKDPLVRYGFETVPTDVAADRSLVVSSQGREHCALPPAHRYLTRASPTPTFLAR